MRRPPSDPTRPTGTHPPPITPQRLGALVMRARFPEQRITLHMRCESCHAWLGRAGKHPFCAICSERSCQANLGPWDDLGAGD